MGTGPDPSNVPPVVDGDVPDLRCTSERVIVDLQGDGPLVSLGRYRYLTARDTTSPQRHPGLLVVALPIRSAVEFDIDGMVVNLVPGQVIAIPPHTVYAIGRHTQPRGELFWLVARVSDPGTSDLAAAVGQLADGTRLSWTAPASVADHLGRALDQPTDRRWASIAVRRSLSATALFELLLARDDGAAGSTRTIRPGVRRALAYLDERVEQPIAVNDLIEASGMSPTQFYDAFAVAVGTSPKDYILRAKIARARLLLAEPQQRIIDVCYRLGFSSSQHFAEVFRRYEGISPSQFRRLK